MRQQMAANERRWKLSRMHGLLAYFQQKFVSWRFEWNDRNLCFGMKHVGRGYKVSASFVPSSKVVMFQCHYPDSKVIAHRYTYTVDGDRGNAFVFEEVTRSLLPDYVREFEAKFGKKVAVVKNRVVTGGDIERVMVSLKLARSHLRMLLSKSDVGRRTIEKVRSAIKSFEGAVRNFNRRLSK